MTTLIVLPAMCTHAQLDRVIDDLFEAMDYEKRTGFVTRVALERFDRHGLPVYTKIPDDAVTDIEWRELPHYPEEEYIPGLKMETIDDWMSEEALAEYREIIKDNE